MSLPVSGRRRVRVAALASAAVLLAGVLAGCSGSSGGGKKEPRAGGASAASASAVPPVSADAYRRWGLERPLAAPPAPPAKKLTDGATGGGVPQVVRRIPTQDKVVFVTFDDGAEKDPEFLKMAQDLKLPFTMFLTDSISRAGSGYDYFDRLRALGNGIDNHTLTHPNLRTLSAEAQKREICGQQEALEKRFGTRPALFRPPYGNYNDATLAAAGGCGVRAVVLWEVTMQINDMRYAQSDKLRPGDIVLAHFRGPQELKGTSMTRMVTNMLRSIQRQGYTVARLEDYL
ncbi:polysaccharide deacetylase family protein [Streptomyces sp. SCA3-4]|uniref:polysaccharide deacetylase family protein n=1 Tax=Streptomyces sichuanensis TaxID=2871810 RepID=UPI001CE26791|nr:polysaccharide deacetylase family protein [Streptomyces sichuanensis]MCA6094726.1 polysaccharide deacetylase family protein [Streptomyces sichuanensis]